MTREKRLELLKQIEEDIHVCSLESTLLDDAKSCAIHSVIEELEQEPKWIPMTTRPMTEEEKDRYREQLEYVDDAVIFNCPLPDDGQEVLITVYGETELDTFYNDSVDGCYFENRDIDDVEAWMSKPKPYKADREDK